MLNEREIESCYLGQFIPVHYHHNMLMDQNRMHNFKSAIHYAVHPGAKVLELGGGTGVLIPVARGQRNIFFIDLGARFHNNGRASYLREGGIEDLPNGDVRLNPINSTANLWTYHIGISIGGR